MTVDPPGVPFPLEHATFDRDQSYTASWTQDGQRRTSVGTYDFNGFKLEVLEAGSLPRTYQAKLRLDGKLVLTYEKGDARVSAILEKVEGSASSSGGE
jgi:hypothetical protein